MEYLSLPGLKGNKIHKGPAHGTASREGGMHVTPVTHSYLCLGGTDSRWERKRQVHREGISQANPSEDLRLSEFLQHAAGKELPAQEGKQVEWFP
jgi:hypothetical protein